MRLTEIVMYILIVINFALCGIVIMKFSQPIKVDLNGWQLQKSDLEEGDIKDFLMVGERFAKMHTYSNANNSKYNCINYTDDLKQIADSLGFKVERINGWPSENETGHTWLRLSVDYEQQIGQFVDYSKTYPIQKVN